MAHALTLGRRGLGRCWPNPAVGCVIVAMGRVVGRGWTQPGGRPHGEVVALAQAAGLARDATVYVTLEPCAHHGQTPPCAQALIDAGVARVVVAMGDPDPRVNGGGIAMLRAAGIEVTVGIGAEEAAWDHAGFLTRVGLGRPMVTLKLAGSLDGRIATAQGESRWITGAAARREVHRMRSAHDSVLIGAGTARADDPMLDVRGFGPVAPPVRVVVSHKLNLPRDGRLARTARAVPTWLIHGDAADPAPWRKLGATTIEVPGNPLDLGAALTALGRAGLTRVLCEGGGALAASLLQGGLVDRMAVFSAGLALGAEGLPSLGALGVGPLAEAPRFTLAQVRRVGADVLHTWVSAPEIGAAGE